MDNQRLKNLVSEIKQFVTDKPIDDEVYIKFAEHLCREYAELYVKPIIQGTKDELVEMHFSRTSDGGLLSNADEVAYYDPPTKSINVNLGYVIGGQDNLEKFKRLLSVIQSVGHEYEHSFQHKYTYYYLLNKQKYLTQKHYRAKDNDIVNKEVYKKVIGERAEEIAEDFISDPYNENEIKTMLKFFKGLEKDMNSLLSEEELQDENAAADLCRYAMYFKRAVEEDARLKERQIFGKFAEDIKNVEGINPIFSVLIDQMVKLGEEEERLQQQQDTPIYKRIKARMKNLSERDFVEFGKLLQNANLIGLKEMRYFADPEISYSDFFVKQKILLDAFKFLFLNGKEVNGSKFWNSLEQLNKVRLAFLKHGLSSASALVEEANGAKFMPYELNTRFRDGYYLMLKNEPITSMSFDKIDLLKPGQKLDILTNFIESGRYEFANSMIFSMGKEINKYLSADKVDVDAELKKIREEGDVIKELYFLDEVEPVAKYNIIDSIEKRVNLLDKEQKEGKLCFDDVDEMIYLLSTLCTQADVPYYKEYALLPQDDSKNAKVANKLYGLYKKVEEVGRREACRISGYELNPDAYRYAHAQDRQDYLLKGRDREKRIEKLYGKNELARIQRENNIEREYEEEKE